MAPRVNGMFIFTFRIDNFLHLCQFLNPEDIVNLGRTCKAMNHLQESNEYHHNYNIPNFWKILTHEVTDDEYEQWVISRNAYARTNQLENTRHQINNLLSVAQQLMLTTLASIPSYQDRLDYMRKIYSTYIKKTVPHMKELDGRYRQAIRIEGKMGIEKRWVYKEGYTFVDPTSRLTLGIANPCPQEHHNGLQYRCQMLQAAAAIVPPLASFNLGSGDPKTLIEHLYIAVAAIKPLTLTMSIIQLLLHTMNHAKMVHTYTTYVLQGQFTEEEMHKLHLGGISCCYSPRVLDIGTPFEILHDLDQSHLRFCINSFERAQRLCLQDSHINQSVTNSMNDLITKGLKKLQKWTNKKRAYSSLP